MSPIPVLLLKTRSTPHDAYDDYFSGYEFSATFVPVLEHRPNVENLQRIKGMVEDGSLGEKYGGMIFTSQRAVEGFAGVVEEISKEKDEGGMVCPPSLEKWLLNVDVHCSFTMRADLSCFLSSDPNVAPVRLPIFPLYTVGPATARALAVLISSPNPPSSLASLNLEVLGAHTGNGAALACFILTHYNTLYSDLLFTFFEAPRLPFIPLLGPGSQQYIAPGRRRLERDDPRLRKKGLLFCVGEVRRDVIPVTLQDEKIGDERVMVEEVEVYTTGVMAGFENNFQSRMRECEERRDLVVVVIVFSPSSCEGMLCCLDFLDQDCKVTEKARTRWDGGASGTKYLVATIGPTTRDHLIEKFGFEPDVCAKKPSPEGIGDAVKAFLRQVKTT